MYKAHFGQNNRTEAGIWIMKKLTMARTTELKLEYKF
jgi:hypothetical protein